MKLTKLWSSDAITTPKPKQHYAAEYAVSYRIEEKGLNAILFIFR
jgi:hypothetical protein